jgi:hypothetical protein
MVVISDKTLFLNYPVINPDRIEKGLNRIVSGPCSPIASSKSRILQKKAFMNDGNNNNIKTEAKLTIINQETQSCTLNKQINYSTLANTKDRTCTTSTNR